MPVAFAGDVAAIGRAARKIYSSWIHSLPQLRPRAGSKVSKRSLAGNPRNRGGDGGKPEKEAPKASYMRNTIAGVSRILRASTWEEALGELRGLPIKWDSYTVNQVLKSHPPMEKAWLFFLWVAQVRGFKHDHFTYTTMLDIFGEAGRISSMEFMFREMEEKGLRIDASTYTSALHWYAKAGDLEASLRLWEEMRRTGCDPTVVSYTAFMKVLFDHGRPRKASAIYREMIEARLSPTCHTYTVLINHLAGSGKFDAALGVMNRMRKAGVEPDKATCNILVQKCSKLGETAAMFEVLRHMRENSLVLRLPIFLEALECLRKAGESDRLLRERGNGRIYPDLAINDVNSCIDRGIINILLCKRNFAAINLMLEGIILLKMELGAELNAAIIQASCRSQSLSTALLAFQLSVQLGQRLERHVYLSLVGPLMRSSRFQEALKITEEMASKGHSLGAYLASVLTLRLGRAGKPAIATELFSSAASSASSSPADRNTLTYTALLHAHLQSMEVEKGLEIFSQMREEGNTDAEFFRKERRRLQRCHSEGVAVPVEESLCNFFFAGG
ncbi:unnamed protein product [Spirodela intermedia]|uniref:Uncharacterized protein n=1 Tax=Spirodela intermedia TaxID=51605 RepID=A0A7I8JBE9_SPIIN|nr:unnamed protein product [Spirodela intermedia]CAA6667419.1 unnamed protein product [Spirodela intermedia]